MKTEASVNTPSTSQRNNFTRRIQEETLLYRHVHASATGESGNPAQACALLERTVADWETVAPAGDAGLEAARASRDYWRSRTA